ncbi:MAG: rod shape-determining protein MreD [Lachnospiraceae bacterium]|nr:rod shape-determining protein MreD [Lachnospiraceae bacterium]
MKRFQYLFLKAFLVLLLIFAGFILQTSIFRGLKLAGIVPNIMVIITSSLGFMRGPKTGAMTGFFCGLCIDTYSCILFGSSTFILMLLGYLNGVFNRLFFGESIRLPLFMVAITDVLYGSLVYLTLFFSRHRNNVTYYLMNVSLPEMVYTIVVFVFLYFFIYRFNILLDTIDKRSARRIAR